MRLKGARAKGITYQKKVEKLLRRTLPDVKVGQWIEFFDAAGRGYAQPDFFLVGPHSTIVIESKLSQRPEGITQIELLYRPLLRRLYSRPVVGVLVCRNLYSAPKYEITSPVEAIDLQEEVVFTWHYLG